MKLFFEDFDKLRKGHCNEDKFKSALSLALYFLNLNFKEADLQKLLAKYRLDTDLIRYQNFIDGVDAPSDSQVATAEAYDAGLEEEMQQLINYYRHIISIDRVHLKEPFQDFDRSKCSHIKKSQFRRVLDLLKFLPPNDRLFDALCARYCDNGNPNEVNYVKFLKEIDDVNELLKTLNIGIKTGESNFKPSEVVSNPKDLKMMNTLYIRK